MAQTVITNNTPQVILQGINDESIVPLLPQVESIPIHLPLFYIQAPWGPVDDVLFLGEGDLSRIYGAEVADPRSLYFNHAGLMASLVSAQGNTIAVKRVVRPAADDSNAPAKARMTLMCTVDSTTPIHPYIRDVNGAVVLDVDGNPTFDDQATVAGGMTLKLEWVATGSFTAQQLEAPMTDAGNPKYPLVTADAAFIGVRGNQTGIRMWAAVPDTTAAADPDVVDNQQAMLYNAQLIYKPLNATATIVTDTLGDNITTFALKPGAYDYKTNLDLTIQGLVTRYSDDGVLSGLTPTYGPLSAITVHQTNLETLLDTLLAVENVLAPTDVASKWLINFLTAVDANGIPFYSFQIDATGSILNEGFTAYLKGGNDGDLTDATFETAVLSEINTNYENPLYPLLDSARYPFSCVYDSGFSFAGGVKQAIFKWMSYRKDVHVGVGTHSWNEEPLTVAEELSIGTALKNAAMLYSESVAWGTPACRAVIMMQSGKLVNHSYQGRVSTLYDLAIKRAGYFGAGSGVVNAEKSYAPPNNQITTLKDLSNRYLPKTVRPQLWLLGMNYAQSFDRRRYFYPALQTIYGIPGSVLTSERFMQICADVQKQAEIVWRLVSGTDDKTEAQFIDLSNKLLEERTAGRYGEGIQVVPNTYFTAADTARGYSWIMDVSIYGNVPKTVGVVNVITRRAANNLNIIGG